MSPEVMLSSTLRGPEATSLRNAALSGIRRAQCAASACEDWPATPDSTLHESQAATRNADVYLLVLGARYGTIISESDPRSFSEVEFDQATEAGVPRLAFVQEPFVVEGNGPAAEIAADIFRRQLFKEKITNRADVTVKTFQTADELRNEVTLALLKLDIRERGDRQTCATIPSAPFHVVHEYALLDTDLAGRAHDLQRLSEWAQESCPIMIIEAFGGFGKTALSWWWWESQRAEATWDKGFWFSFYEAGASMSEFFAQLHAHLADEPLETSRRRPVTVTADKTLALMRGGCHLVVLDGFERMLNLSNSLSANQEAHSLHKKLVGDSQSDSAPELRSTRGIQDPLLSQWLVKIANQSNSRILITTRYHPRDLETVAEKPRRGVSKIELKGLELNEARSYWQSIGLDATDPGLARLVAGVHGHPLALTVMAGNLRTSHLRSLEDFFERHPEFPFFDQDVKQRDGRDDVFCHALANLDKNAQLLLGTIAAYAMPAPVAHLQRLLCPPPATSKYLADLAIVHHALRSRDETKPTDADRSEPHFTSDDEVLRALLLLEDRKLVSRNRDNACDLHPVIRSVVRDRSSKAELEESDNRIIRYYIEHSRYAEVRTSRDLMGEIQLVFSATRSKLWPTAIRVCSEHLCDPLERLNENRLLVRILQQFFTIETRSEQIRVKWRVEAPDFHFDLPAAKEMRAKRYTSAWTALGHFLRQDLGFKDDQLWAIVGCTDFAMSAAKACESLGDYRLAQAFYELHNSGCYEPLCQTMQETCYEQAGEFGAARQLLREGFARFRAHDYWKSNPSELLRLASCLFAECVERELFDDARLSFVRFDRIALTWPQVRFDNTTELEWFRRRNLMLARLALAENQLENAIWICKEVVSNAEQDAHQRDLIRGLRLMAQCLRQAGQFDAALALHDRIIASDSEGAQNAGILDDRAARARARIGLNQLKEARGELDDVIERAATAIATRARTLIYKSELLRRLGDSRDEIKVLREALGHYARRPGTPSDLREVRTCIARLRELKAITAKEVSACRFADSMPWPEEILAGRDKAKVSRADGGAIMLQPIWSFARRRDARRGRRHPSTD